MVPPRLAAVGLGLVLFTGGLGLLTCGVESCKREQVGAFEKKADEAKGRADAHAGTAGAADARAAGREGDLAQAEARVARLQVELERLRHRPVEVRPVLPEAPAPARLDPVGDLGPLVAKQDELIQAQACQIQGLKAQVLDLTTARDHWRGAFRSERDRALSLELALEAQKSVARASLWKGRIQGLAVGFAAGYVVDRTRR